MCASRVTTCKIFPRYNQYFGDSYKMQVRFVVFLQESCLILKQSGNAFIES